jgi:protein-disulfide isomerase
LAAARQGKYIEFHTTILNSRLIPTPAYIEALAAQVGVDQTRLSVDMNAGEIVRAIEHNADLASELGLTGTPVLIVGRTVVEGAISGRQLERLLIEEYSHSTRNVCDDN